MKACRKTKVLVPVIVICLLSLTSLAAEPLHERFEDGRLGNVWTASTVLSQGPGAVPKYAVSEGRLIWSYESGTSNAQQTVLLRNDGLPTAGQAVEVRLFPEDYPRGQQDFAGLALSSSETSLKDRQGLLIFFLEPTSGHLRFWNFGSGSESPSVSHSAAPELSEAKTLLLRLVRVGQQHVRASWSTDGERFHWLPAVRFGPVRAIGLYNGNSRNSRGNRLAFDDFRVLRCESPDRPEDYEATTPPWTSADAFLPAEGSGSDLGWPAVRPEARPGAYWWWPGSAVTQEDLTWNLETYRKAGWGNMGVIGIYGVRGEEERFIDVFSPKWFEMFNYAVAEAKRLGMNVDLTPSSGWRMGGPHVTPEFGEQNFVVENGRIEAQPNRANVKRAGPGGEGLAINPYSQSAVAFHLDWMDKHFAEGNGAAPRAFYYDSFENPGNWCPEFLESFRQLRGYPLEEHAEALAGRGDAEQARRVVCDYRETLSEVLIGRVEQVVRWGEQRGSGLRMQAHGAPANLLDMYAAASIPETEVFGASRFDIPGFRRDPALIRPDRQSDLVNRFASSSAHVAGRKVVISESFTWLRNHYHTALSHIKAESDKLLLNGINCIYYHGICYAPKETTWPGWLFYASTQANARNSIFRDIPVLNAYITRCQSVLQEGTPHNDMLVYWPVYDLWMGGGHREIRFSVHHPDWIDATACGEAGRWMIEHGYTFDFASDAQVQSTRVDGQILRTDGGEYRTLLVPAAKFMTIETARHLLALAEAGATVLVWKGLPQDVPGWHDHADRKQRLTELLAAFSQHAPGMQTVGKGRLVIGDDLQQLLEIASIAREPLVDHGLQFIRRKSPNGVSYFIANHTAEPVRGWVGLASLCRSALLMDPMTGRTGVAPLRGGEEMGLAPSRHRIDPGDSVGREVPVPISSPPLCGGEKMGLAPSRHRIDTGDFVGREVPVPISSPPLCGESGQVQVYLQMQPGETRVLRTFADKTVDGPGWPITEPSGEPIVVAGQWSVEFTEGGPVLPQPFSTRELKCWTEIGGELAERFAGAARYTIQVDLPEANADGWFLDLGDVRESARVWVNDRPAGIVVAHPFRLDLSDLLKPGRNELAIEVTNLSANRIRDLDKRGVDWKKFHEINFVDHMYKPFDSSGWDPKPSGLLGPVTLTPYRILGSGA